jgi:hypothetical protein
MHGAKIVPLVDHSAGQSKHTRNPGEGGVRAIFGNWTGVRGLAGGHKAPQPAPKAPEPKPEPAPMTSVTGEEYPDVLKDHKKYRKVGPPFLRHTVCSSCEFPCQVLVNL